MLLRAPEEAILSIGWGGHPCSWAPVSISFLMSRASPKMRVFAKRLITYKAAGDKSAHPKSQDVFNACERLRPSLVALMGNNGFRTLLSRAIALAGEEISW